MSPDTLQPAPAERSPGPVDGRDAAVGLVGAVPLRLQRPRANADPHRLQQCLTALVDNALLYSDGPAPTAAVASANP